MKSIVTCVFLIFCVVLLILFLFTILKKMPIKYILLIFLCLFSFAAILWGSLIPGSEISFELPGGIKYTYKTPSELDKVLDKVKEKNSDQKTYTLTISKSGSGAGTVRVKAIGKETISSTDIHFPKGEEYIVGKKESQDGKQRTFDVMLPADKKIQFIVPSQVTMYPIIYDSPNS